MEPTIKTIDTKHVEYFVLHLAGSDLYGRPRPVGRGVGADVPVPEVAAHRSRDVAVSGIEFSAAFPPSGGGVGERRPPRALRHRTQPPGHGRYRRALPCAAQFPLGFQTRSLPHPLLRAVPARPRRHLHRQGTCRRGVGAAAPRRRAVVVARSFGGDLSGGNPLEGRPDPPIQGRGFHVGQRGRCADPSGRARRYAAGDRPQPPLQLAQPHHREGAAARAGGRGRGDRDPRPDGRRARADGRSSGRGARTGAAES